MRKKIAKQKKKKTQKGGIFSLLAEAIPALALAGKAAALGTVGEAASYGAKKAIDAATRKQRR